MKRTAAQNPIRERKKCAAFVKALFSPAVFPSVVLQCDSTRLPRLGDIKRKVKGLFQKIVMVFGRKTSKKERMEKTSQ